MTQDSALSREYPSRPIVGVGAVILVAAEESPAIGGPALAVDHGVVLVRRRFEPLAGRWSLPGGALDVGEPLERGVAREVAEETGLTVEVGAIVDVFDRILPDATGRVQYHFVLIDYVCRPRGGRLGPGSDVSDVVIADPARLDAYELTEKALEVIAKAMHHVV